MVIPTSAITSPLYRRVTLRLGAEYLSILLIEIWLEHAKGLSRLSMMSMILAPSNLIAKVLHTPAQLPHFRSLLASSVTQEHSYLNPMLQLENTRYPVRRATERTIGYRRGVRATASKVRQYYFGTWPGYFSSDLSSKYQVSIYCAKFRSTQASPNHLTVVSTYSPLVHQRSSSTRPYSRIHVIFPTFSHHHQLLAEIWIIG